MPQFLRTLIRRFRALRYIDPERDWITLLIISAILLSGVVVWNMYVFDTVANGGIIGSPPAAESPIFSQSSLDAIHTVFENRAAEEAKYLTDEYHYIDPSQ